MKLLITLSTCTNTIHMTVTYTNNANVYLVIAWSDLYSQLNEINLETDRYFAIILLFTPKP
jgi:hypothetical protein